MHEIDPNGSIRTQRPQAAGDSAGRLERGCRRLRRWACSRWAAAATAQPSSSPEPPPTLRSSTSRPLGDDSASTYAIDRTANTFVRNVYGAEATVTDSGVVSALPNGIVSLGIAYNLSPVRELPRPTIHPKQEGGPWRFPDRPL